jgi:Spy/CpxP family protein refolding chaperone
MRRGAWYGGLALVVATLVLVPTVGAARGGGKRFGPGRMARMAEALELTTEQRAQMREVVEKYRGGALGDHRQALREARAQLRAVIHDVSATDAQVQEAAREVSSHAGFVAVERHRMAIEMDRILTEEQKEKAAELRQRRWEGRRGSEDREIDAP